MLMQIKVKANWGVIILLNTVVLKLNPELYSVFKKDLILLNVITGAGCHYY